MGMGTIASASGINQEGDSVNDEPPKPLTLRIVVDDLRPIISEAVADAIARINPEQLVKDATDRAVEKLTDTMKKEASKILKDPSEFTNKVIAGFVEKLAADEVFRQQIHAATTFMSATVKDVFLKGKDGKDKSGGIWGTIIEKVMGKIF